MKQTCGGCYKFSRDSLIFHWGLCSVNKTKRRDNWTCDVQRTGESVMTIKVKHVEGVVVCPKCRGIGAEIQHDGSKHWCRMCGGGGQLLENDNVSE